MKHLIFVLLLIPIILMAQEPELDSVRIQKEYFQNELIFVASNSLFNKRGYIELGNREGWLFHPGDDLNRAEPDFDDSDWMYFKSTGLKNPIPDGINKRAFGL